jgi:two-component system phosphate regulon sensor histidine kinase PhoR
MSIARLERENEVLEPIENFKILTFIEHSLDLFKEKISKKHIKIETICNSSIEIRANFNLLGQALVNLIDNAIKFTPEHGTILISAEKKNNEVILSVTDYGSGIPHEHIPHIFERFYRVDTGRSRREGGTGLGLAIVKHIAQVHNGSVKVISIPDQKTIFSIHLPKTQTEL